MPPARTLWTDFMAMLQAHLHGVEWNMNETFSMIQRRWKLVAVVTSVFFTLAFVLLLVTPPTYQAESLIQINTRQEQVVNMNDVVGDLSVDDSAIRTEIDVLKSRKLAARVINDLHLGDSPLLRGQDNWISLVAGSIRFFLFPNAEAPVATAKDKEREQTRAINAFLKHLDVNVSPRSYSIRVSFEAGDPALAATIVNAVTKAYLTSQLEDKFETTRLATAWMNDRLRQMQRDVQQADRAVEAFRDGHGLTETHGVTLTEQQLSELNTQLIMARTQLAEAQAKITSTNRGVSTASEVLNSPLIQNLRLQETEVRRKMSDLSAKYGPRHPLMVTVRSELANVQGKIAEETSKIRTSLDSNVDMAQARVNTLQDQLDQLQNKTRLSTDANVQLAELERQSQALRTLYQNFLDRSKELSQMDFPKSDARVIYPAEAPLSPTSPKKVLVLALSILLGLGVGVGLALLLEALDSGFRTTQQLENVLKQTVLGMIGEVPEHPNMSTYLRDKPTSAFAECVRAVRTALRFARPDTSPKVVLVTSSVPQEGKSTFSMSLAQAVSLTADQKVLLIDADLRRPKLAKQFGLEPKVGLAEVLAGTAKLKDALLKIPHSSLTLLPAMPNAQFSQELLGSQKMKELMEKFRQDYDFVLVDSPPVMAVADSITLSPLVDAVMFMVRWGTTPRAIVLHAIKQLAACHAPLAGCVLTRVSLEKQHAYGYGDYGYYYGKYKDYYSE